MIRHEGWAEAVHQLPECLQKVVDVAAPFALAEVAGKGAHRTHRFEHIGGRYNSLAALDCGLILRPLRWAPTNRLFVPECVDRLSNFCYGDSPRRGKGNQI